MNDAKTADRSRELRPLCLKCLQPMMRREHVVNAGGREKSVETWRCPEHDPAQPARPAKIT